MRRTREESPVNSARHLRTIAIAIASAFTVLAWLAPTVGSAQAAMPAKSMDSASMLEKYARYTPFPCAVIGIRRSAAAQSVRTLTWRTWWFDTTTAFRVADSLAAIAEEHKTAAELRACLAPYLNANAPPRHLVGIGMALLDLDEDAQAEAVFQRVLRSSRESSIDERAWLLSRLVESHASGNSARRKKALDYMAQLDALGPAAGGRRLAARNGLYEVAQRIDSLPFMEEQAKLALQTARELKGDAQAEWLSSIVGAFMHQADFEGRRGNYPAAIAVLKQAQREFGALGNMQSVEDAILFRYGMYGTPMRPIQSTFVYVPGQSASLPAVPKQTAGKARLYIFTSDRGLDLSMPLFESTQRVLAKSGAKVEAVLLTHTSGFDEDKLIPDPKDEAPRIQEFFHSYLAIPGTLVVWALPVTGKSEDGRVLRGGDPNWMPNATVVLVDQNGLIRNIDDGTETRLLHMIDELSRSAGSH